MKVINFVAFVLCCGMGNCNLLLSDEKQKELIASTQWILYPGPDMSSGIPFQLNELPQLIASDSFRPSLTTLIYLHGFHEDQTKESVITIYEAYQSTGAYNIVMIDWSVGAAGNYVEAVINSVALGKAVGQIIADALSKALLIRDRLVLVGHSLGAQTISVISETLENFNWKLMMAIGLDPAGPLEDPISNAIFGGCHLSASDADFVLIVHTDKMFYGYALSTGTADINLNGGTRYQPGCPLTIPLTLTKPDLCSHQRSWAYWAEAVRVPRIGPPIYVIRALTWAFFMLGLTEKDSVEKLGPDWPKTAKGSYYGITNATSPYSLGMAGTRFLA